MMKFWRKWVGLECVVAFFLATGAAVAADGDTSCTDQAGPACLQSFDLPGEAGHMRYYSTLSPSARHADAPRSALVVMHGHPRDAGRSFGAGLLAASRAGRLGDTLVVAPIYQVPEAYASRCSSQGVPTAQVGDAVWTCAGWLAGERSLGDHPIGSFAALDALVAELARQWPSLRTVTLAGFSAGAQMLQHSVGFAPDTPAGLVVRYVIADPGSWLYFDPVRPQLSRAGSPVEWAECGSGDEFPKDCQFTFQAPPEAGRCTGFDAWKYGTQSLPSHLGRDGDAARARYAAASIDYLEGALDSSAAKGAFYPILDKSCAAMLQGPFRLQRGVAYAAYENAVIQPRRPRTVTIVPNCGHDVTCVLPSEAARPALFPPQH